MHTGGFLGGTVGKNPPLHTGDMVWIPGLEDPTCHGAVKPVLPETRHRNEKLEHHNQERPCSQRPSTRVHAHTTDTHTHTHTHKHIRGGCMYHNQEGHAATETQHAHAHTHIHTSIHTHTHTHTHKCIQEGCVHHNQEGHAATETQHTHTRAHTQKHMGRLPRSLPS